MNDWAPSTSMPIVRAGSNDTTRWRRLDILRRRRPHTACQPGRALPGIRHGAVRRLARRDAFGFTIDRIGRNPAFWWR
jgi:hypothetical protein